METNDSHNIEWCCKERGAGDSGIVTTLTGIFQEKIMRSIANNQRNLLQLGFSVQESNSIQNSADI